jgi:AcrR family transcriptional regulator
MNPVLASTAVTTAAPAAPQSGPGDSARERLLRTALARFSAEGALAATLDDIRREAGVSVGALYHHFPDKTALAGALYAELAGRFQEGFSSELRAHRNAEDGVRGGVCFYLHWVGENRDEAAFLLGQRPGDDALLRERNRPFFKEVTAWWKTHVRHGTLRDLQFDLIHALWLGPAHEYTRHWLAGRARRVPGAVAGALADAAWQTLKEDA